MKSNELEQFNELLAGVHAFYRRDFSEFGGMVYWQALKPYDFAAVKEAFSRHAVNPDTGKFMPMPADIVKMLQGSTQDSALAAWAKVDRAIRTVGTYRSVIFDDALIHRVLTEMGGWIDLGRKTEDEWPFVRNEFVNRYRGYKMRSEVPDYPPHLIGMSEAQNSKAGFRIDPPLLLGNPEMAANVARKGSDAQILQVTMAKPETLRIAADNFSSKDPTHAASF